MFPFCVENAGQILTDPTQPPDLPHGVGPHPHPRFLNIDDDGDLDHDSMDGQLTIEIKGW